MSEPWHEIDPDEVEEKDPDRPSLAERLGEPAAEAVATSGESDGDSESAGDSESDSESDGESEGDSESDGAYVTASDDVEMDADYPDLPAGVLVVQESDSDEESDADPRSSLEAYRDLYLNSDTDLDALVETQSETEPEEFDQDSRPLFDLEGSPLDPEAAWPWSHNHEQMKVLWTNAYIFRQAEQEEQLAIRRANREAERRESELTEHEGSEHGED